LTDTLAHGTFVVVDGAQVDVEHLSACLGGFSRAVKYICDGINRQDARFAGPFAEEIRKRAGEVHVFLKRVIGALAVLSDAPHDLSSQHHFRETWKTLISSVWNLSLVVHLKSSDQCTEQVKKVCVARQAVSIVRTHASSRTLTHTNTQNHSLTYYLAHSHAYTCIHTYNHTYMHTLAHTHTHTHTYTHLLSLK
jgi:hypothetical protein